MSDRSMKISRLKTSRASRAAYIKGKLTILIPAQIRALRLNSSMPKQAELAREAGMRQSRISAMEKPGAGNYNLETLVRVASALKVGLIVKFCSFSEMLRWENRFSQDEFNPVTIDNDAAFDTEEAALIPSNVAEVLDQRISGSDSHKNEMPTHLVPLEQPDGRAFARALSGTRASSNVIPWPVPAERGPKEYAAISSSAS